jgi:hypothetical protein
MEDSQKFPDAPQTAAAKVARGHLGLEEMSHAVDWQLALDLGPAVARVLVTPRSPAKKAGIASGDYVVSVNGTSLEAFTAGQPPAGTVALIKVFRVGKGFLLFDAILSERPEITRPSKALATAVPCGAPVARNERLKWLSRITGDPRLLPMDKALAARLVLYYLNRKGEAYPAHDTLANELSVSVSSVKRSIVKLQRAGLLHIASGRKRGRSNCYSLSWPNDSGSNVVRILRGGNE